MQVWRLKFECAMARDEVNAMTEGRYRLIESRRPTIKLRALLRYRRIPFDWVIMTKALRKATEHMRPNLIPVLLAGTARLAASRPVTAAQRRRDRLRVLDALDQHVDAIAAPE